MEEVKVWTDGACFPNPGMGGWGWTTLNGEFGSGGLKQTTNQVMELTAALEAIKSLKSKYSKILLITDSMYVINTATIWWHKWSLEGWCNSKGQPVKNLELIQDLISVSWNKGVIFEWVKGHSGDLGNETADALATKARGADEKLIKKCANAWHAKGGKWIQRNKKAMRSARKPGWQHY